MTGIERLRRLAESQDMSNAWTAMLANELTDIADQIERETEEQFARLMPDGYEWPRYESGEPLRYEDRYVYDGREREVWHVDFDSYGEPTILNKDGTRFHPDKGERVKRPAPKVLAADGKPLEVGQTVWDTNGDELVIGALEDGGHTVTCRYVDVGDAIPVHGMWSPSQLTHERPDSWARDLVRRAKKLAGVSE